MRLKTLSNLLYMVKFQKVPMILIEESVYRGDTIDFDKKSQHNFARISSCCKDLETGPKPFSLF